MKKDKQNTCPGCGKHCPLSSPRCKYGRTYLAKISAKAQDACGEKEHVKKWEKHLIRGGMVWQLLSVGRLVKKALHNGQTTEEQLISRLSAEERETLSIILTKLSAE